MTRDEMFAKAKQAREEEQKKEEERRNWTPADFEDICYTALVEDTDKVIRILGAPIEVRAEKSDPKKISYSMVVGDDGKQFRCIWPQREDAPDWLMWKIYNLVMTYKWDRTKGEKGEKVYTYKESHPEVFDRVAKNNRDHKYERGWYPTTSVIMNVIDRHDMEWHKENKHTKLLSKKASEYNGSWFFEPGVPVQCYNTIWDDVVEYSGNWEDYDVAIRKKTSAPFYTAICPVKELFKLQDVAKSLVIDAPLSEEEKSWERYDIDKLFPVTSYTKLKKHLDVFIQLVDRQFGKKFHQELLDLAEDERKRREAESKEKEEKPVFHAVDTSAPPVSDPVDSGIGDETSAPTPTRSAPVRRAAKASIDWDKLTSGELNGTKYLGVSEMTEEEKSMVLGVNDDGSFEYVKEYKGKPVTLFEDEASHFKTPEQYHVDPLSGAKYQ